MSLYPDLEYCCNCILISFFIVKSEKLVKEIYFKINKLECVGVDLYFYYNKHSVTTSVLFIRNEMLIFPFNILFITMCLSEPLRHKNTERTHEDIHTTKS